MMKKLLSVLAAALLVTGLFAGCGATSQSGTVDSASTGEKKVLKVGFCPMSAPFCWIQYDDSNGAIPLADRTGEYGNGFDVMMMKKYCDLAGYDMEVYFIDWDGLLLAVQSGNIDCAAADIGITDERKASMDFSDPYYKAGFTCLVRANSTYANAKGLKDLKGITCTSQLNTMWYDMLSQIPDANKQDGMDNLSSMVVALQSNMTDLILVDKPTAMAITTSNPDLKMLELDPSDDFVTTPEQVDMGIAIRKGNDDVRLALNKAIAQVSTEEEDKVLQQAIEAQPLTQDQGQ